MSEETHMRSNTTITIDLPCDLRDMIEAIERVTAVLAEPRVFRASFVEHSQRDGTPAHVSFSIGGELRTTT